MRGRLGIRTFEVAFPEVKRDLVQRALFPFFRLRQPEDLTLGIPQRALAADKLLTANLDQLFHELHSCGVKPICPNSLTESGRKSLNLLCRCGSFPYRLPPALRCSKSAPLHFPELTVARTATHFSMSARMKSANSFGVPPSGSVPCRFSAVRTSSMLSAALAAADNFSTIADGGPAGASSPIQMPAS